MQTLGEIRQLLARHGATPRHALGQNFLHAHNMLRKLLGAAALQPGQVVLEVGPGTGTLTEELAAAGAVVVACELDPAMAAIVRERLGAGVTLVEGDCLHGKHALSPALLAALAGRPFRLVANLPYQAATPLLATLLESHPECDGAFVTIQREVAERMTAAPRSAAWGALSVLMQLQATLETVAILPGGCFWPPPRVESAMVAIRRRPDAPLPPAEARAFGTFVASLFSRRRKQLGTTLGRGAALPPGVSATQRPEELTPAEWLLLWRLTVTPGPRPSDRSDTPS